jgi:hypothetical protein
VSDKIPEKKAPVQGFSAGIPWSMHLRAYDAYCKEYGPQQALIDLEARHCRGGFSTSELDVFIPGWRKEVSELISLRHENAELKEDRDSLQYVVKQFMDALGGDTKGKPPWEKVAAWKKENAELREKLKDMETIEDSQHRAVMQNEELRAENERMKEPTQHLFESHCINTGHKTSQTCPICYQFVAARTGGK